MADQPHEPPGASVLTGPDVDKLLGAVLDAVGARLHEWDVRSVHRRGTSSVAVVYEVVLTDGDGVRRERLYVAHVSTRPVPSGAATLDVDGARVHVWQFPHDPYLPGLAAAVNRRAAAELLEGLGFATANEHRPGIHTRSYRPTRRAVVELRPADGLPPVAYCKLLGGRDAERVQRRATRLSEVHEHLGAALPVPPVLDADPEAGLVVLGALPGSSLRQALRAGGETPTPDEVVQLLTTLHGLDGPPGDADPDGYADTSRHVTRITRRLPQRADGLERAAAVAASVSGPRGTVHGDLHDGQLLVGPGGSITGLLDVDGAGTGFIAHDLGRLLAHTEASAVAVPDSAAAVEAYVQQLWDAMAELAPPRDIAAAATGAWVGLATGPLRVASPRWKHEVGERIDRALAWADRAG